MDPVHMKGEGYNSGVIWKLFEIGPTWLAVVTEPNQATVVRSRACLTFLYYIMGWRNDDLLSPSSEHWHHPLAWSTFSSAISHQTRMLLGVGGLSSRLPWACDCAARSR
ncbi:hypothetical protein FRB94_001303 [Tulasnella sp. JGI-2019a]|nr:hypothetical protein FRB94_001303 [Tulasnella sp. JGI-2019a]